MKGNEIFSLKTKEVGINAIKTIKSELALNILKALSERPSYPFEISKKINVNEQKVYYHIRNLEKAGIIKVIGREEKGGATAKIYALSSPSFSIKFTDMQKTQKLSTTDPKKKVFLDPFIKEEKFNAWIVVGSPDPHGPEKARSRDGYYGIDLAIFFGSLLNYIPAPPVKLDTEMREEDLKKNLVLLGGPVVNRIVSQINEKMPIYFDREDRWNISSKITKKKYSNEETGIIVKMKNPFNEQSSILVVAGKRHFGTKAAVIAFLKNFDQIMEGNKYNPAIFAHVVEGVDADSDGIIESVEFKE